MQNAVFIRKGHGYEVTDTLNTHLERCTAFDGFHVIAHPLADRESRILGRDADGKQGSGTDYRSHDIRLAVEANGTAYKGNRAYFLLMSHGSGREVLRLPTVFDRGVGWDALLAMPEAALYSVLMLIYKTAQDARDAAASETRREWATAYDEKRIRIRRRDGRRWAEIEAKQLAPATA